MYQPTPTSDSCIDGKPENVGPCKHTAHTAGFGHQLPGRQLPALNPPSPAPLQSRLGTICLGSHMGDHLGPQWNETQGTFAPTDSGVVLF